MLGAQQLERMREHLAASLRASSQLSERDIEVSGEGRRDPDSQRGPGKYANQYISTVYSCS